MTIGIYVNPLDNEHEVSGQTSQFVARAARPVQSSVTSDTVNPIVAMRSTTPSPASREQVASVLAQRPYDLRHACVSTWLNAGVPATQVAERAGHSVDVLRRICAKCIDGQDSAARKRIEDAIGSPPRSWPQGAARRERGVPSRRLIYSRALAVVTPKVRLPVSHSETVKAGLRSS